MQFSAVYPSLDKGKRMKKQGPKKEQHFPKGMGPLTFAQKDRDTFRRLLATRPEDLRRFVALSFARMPFAGPQELGRMIFQKCGALIAEVCHWFGCPDLDTVLHEM